MIEDYTRKWYFCTKVIIEASVRGGKKRKRKGERERQFAVERKQIHTHTIADTKHTDSFILV